MQISDFSPQDKVLIKCYLMDSNNVSETFEATISEVKDKFLIMEEIKNNDGNPLNFDGNIKIDLYKVEDFHSPIIWSDCRIKKVKYKDQIITVLITKNTEGVKFNRRKSFRVYLGLPAVARLGISRKVSDVFIHDISSSGFPVITNPKYEIHLRDTIRVTFDDDTTHMSLNGICIRKQVLPNGNLLYGCLIAKESQVINSYIAKKQRNKAHK